MNDVEDMKGFTKITSTGSYTKALTKASIEAFMGEMEAFAKVVEAFTEATSTEASTNTYTKCSMEDIKKWLPPM